MEEKRKGEFLPAILIPESVAAMTKHVTARAGSWIKASRARKIASPPNPKHEMIRKSEVNQYYP